MDGKQQDRNINSATQESFAGLTEDEMVAKAISLSLQTSVDSGVLTDAQKKELVRKERLAALEKRGLK